MLTGVLVHTDVGIVKEAVWALVSRTQKKSRRTNRIRRGLILMV
jgi:hypothetical protein